MFRFCVSRWSCSRSVSSLSSIPARGIRDHEELAKMIDKVADDQPPPNVQFSFGRDNLPWKRIVESTHIRPHELTYNARLKKAYPPIKRQTIGPGSPEARWNDAFHQLGLDPLVECQNADLLASFLSEMGKIHGREKTGLTTRTQRRLAKAIRRAKHMGIIPLHSRPQNDSMRTVGASYFL